jgi:tetratricopeptide (TPR) repeat protein
MLKKDSPRCQIEAKLAQGAAPEEVACALNDLADRYVLEGRCDDEVVCTYERALELFEQAGGVQQPDAANVRNNLAQVRLDRGQYGLAEAQARAAVEIMRHLFDQPELVAAADEGSLVACRQIQLQGLRRLGAALRLQGGFEEAERELMTTLDFAREHMGAESEEVAACHNDVGVLYKYWGRWTDAQTHYLQAQALLEAIHGSGSPKLATVLYNLGGLAHAREQYAAAESMCQRALELQQRSLPPEDPQLAVTYGTLAAIYHGLGRHEEALGHYRRALRMHVDRLGTDHVEVALLVNGLGAVAEDLGHLAEAEALYERALRLREYLLGNAHPAVAMCWNNLGLLYSKIGKGAQAPAAFERALAIFEASYGSQHVHTLGCREHLAAARAALSEY